MWWDEFQGDPNATVRVQERAEAWIAGREMLDFSVEDRRLIRYSVYGEARRRLAGRFDEGHEMDLADHLSSAIVRFLLEVQRHEGK